MKPEHDHGQQTCAAQGWPEGRDEARPVRRQEAAGQGSLLTCTACGKARSRDYFSQGAVCSVCALREDRARQKNRTAQRRWRKRHPVVKELPT